MMQLNPLEDTLSTSTPGKMVSLTSHVSPWLTSVMYPLACYFVLPFYFTDIQINGQENLATNGPMILAPTHRSRWDPIMIAYSAGRLATGRDPRFMVTSTEMTGLQGWFIRRLGGFPVDLRRPAIATLRHGVELLLAQQMLVIFPEGGIFQDGQVHPLKPGLARLAIQAESNHAGLGIKILPITINYSHIIPRFFCGVKINIGSPISVAEYCQRSPKQSAAHLTADLETALQQLDAKANGH
jgi:1-acyl-sn-glycerol-3-phosphate acyltransferase